MSLSSDGTFRAEKVPTREFLLLYYHAEGLEMKNLVKIAARLSLQIEDLVLEITNDMDSYNTRRDHIVLLHKISQALRDEEKRDFGWEVQDCGPSDDIEL